MILVIYFLKVTNMTKWCKKDEEKSKSKPEHPISERLNGDDEDLSDILPLFIFNFGLKM